MIQIESYVLTKPIYEGSGVVLYRGYRSPNGASIIAKILIEDYPSERDLARIRHEYLMLKDAELPGVVQALGLEKHRNGLALILADRGGLLLSDAMAEKRIDLGAALRLAVSMADILSGLHRRHIIHKDVKPYNMLVDATLRHATLFDFGIATRLSHELKTATAPEVLEGTLAYMSPEQTGRMNRIVDHRTDLYSMGVTLYEMLTGTLPFQSEDAMELVHSHIARTPVPPYEQMPGVPKVVSDIVMKLMSKAAEDRYQRADGLKVDLARCLEAWEVNRAIESFQLGQQDMAERVVIPQKLYGREVEVATLLVAFDRAGQGAAELLMVTGVAGVGKSVLVNEIHKALARRGGYFIAGKFDVQRGRNGPYSALARAFGELARQVCAAHEDVKAQFQRGLARALGSNGRVLIEVIPELELLVGPQPPVPELGPVESQNRFTLVFQSALREFARADHPLVLFLDDMQWADPASLRLLQILLTSPERGHFLVIGAYRHDEVDGSHPLAQTLGELKSVGAAIQGVMLESLSSASVRELVAEAVGSDRERASPLADLIYEKTKGNPFFVNQLLIALEEDKLITYDARARALVWDLPRCREKLDTEDVVRFMTGRIRRLSPATQTVLTLSACMGYELDLGTLSVINEASARDTAASAWEALSDGLLLPLDNDYRLLDTAGQAEAAEVLAASALTVRFRFLHDRVQQAAYLLVGEGERLRLHLRIGRLLLARDDTSARGGDQLDVLRHYNIAASLLKEPAERLQVARWNLVAGKRARAMTAYTAAEDHFAIASSVLPPKSFESQYELVFGIYLARAECAYLSGRFDLADTLFDELLQRAKTVAERVEIYTLRLKLYLTRGKFAEALRTGYAGLSLFRVAIPETEQGRQTAIEEQIEDIVDNLGDRRAADLMNAPLLTDPGQRALLKMLMALFAPMYAVSPAVATLLLARMVNICLKYGHSEVSAFAYVTYGFLLSGIFGRLREGYEFGKLALDLNEKFGNSELVCKLQVNFSMFLHLTHPLRTVLEYQRRAYHAGLASGDFQYLSFSCSYTLMTRLGLGEDLTSVLDEADRFLLLLARTKEAGAIGYVKVSRQLAACLLGRTRDRGTLEDASFDQGQFLTEMAATGFKMVVTYYHIAMMQVLFLLEDYAGAVAAALEAEETADSNAGMLIATDLPFYHGLALCGMWKRLEATERQACMDKIEIHRSRLATWAESSPDNYHQKLLLLDAELSRIRGDELKAMRLYDEAISSAEMSRIVRDEALANELAANYYRSSGRTRVARLYMTDAFYGYLQWGAVAKVDSIAESHSHLLLTVGAVQSSSKAPRLSARPTIVTTRNTVSKRTQVLDLAAVMKAAHTISSEIVLDKVLDRMMRTIVQTSGAQRGVLLLDRQEGLVVEAVITVNPDKVVVGADARAAGVGVASSILAEVTRTGEAVVVDNAASDARFAADPHVITSRPKSVLCIAMLHQGRRSGLLYLENNDATEMFSSSRVELSTLLASQAAVAVENALLYASVKQVTEELRRANDLLESKVVGRTEELRDSNARLQVELLERARAEAARAEAEAERAVLQEEIIVKQRERLAELSTPSIPITEDVMVMPLIGTMDAPRMKQVHETALEQASATGASVVILDITGIRQMDNEVASSLVKTTLALKLLGVQAVVTGARPEVAQRLVGIEIDLKSLVTRGTLRSGIAYALARSQAAARREPWERGARRPRGC